MAFGMFTFNPLGIDIHYFDYLFSLAFLPYFPYLSNFSFILIDFIIIFRKNSTKGGVVNEFRGCWLGSPNQCHNKTRCIEARPNVKKEISFCCCETSECNREVYRLTPLLSYNTTPSRKFVYMKKFSYFIRNLISFQILFRFFCIYIEKL